MAMQEQALMMVQDYVPQMAISPQQAAQAYQALREVTRQVLQEGTDYGTIPGTPKPCLYKPGAENLLRFYGLGHTVTKTHSVEDWEKGFFHYVYKVTIHKTLTNGVKLVLSECEGSCNTREKKYVKQDPFSVVNTIQKMSIKRALVGAALQATGASGLFTQDLEDMDPSDIQRGNFNGHGSGGNHNGYNNGGGGQGGATNAKSQVINSMKEMGLDWNGLAEVASAALGRQIKKVIQDVQSGEWQIVLDHINAMKNGPAPSDDTPMDLDDENLPF